MAKKREDTVEITETAKSPFRLFNKIEYSPVKVPEKWGDATFYVRPMTNTERAIFSMAEELIKKARDINGAIERSGLTGDDLYTTDDDKAVEVAKNWSAIVNDTVIDEDAEKNFLSAVKKVILDCTEKVSIGEEEHLFSDDMYEEMNGESVRLWLLSQIRNAGTLTDDERVAL